MAQSQKVLVVFVWSIAKRRAYLDYGCVELFWGLTSLSYQKNISKKLKQFKIGDLVQYISHSDGDCSWVSMGSYGIIVGYGRRLEDPSVEVLWTETDMACWVFCEFIEKVPTDKL